ncbi:MoaD/ThiS family protein [Treponema endosymbiont of Eucomonympha sp.]|uniref:MoaD/ThiS family protein n=1 Tax=Treponema endosymbiont of Eucomonympha sp. TaxID=1580831 RepID=UPI0027D32C63|nr:MoaD/ThiS family protein [Treponema endosymbiont of Eucomonympha sp.]
MRSFINVFVGETNIKNLDGMNTRVSDGDTIMLIPAIAGGCRRAYGFAAAWHRA